jgi:TldD protein
MRLDDGAVTTWEELAQRGAAAAKRAGAQYADARLSRTVIHPLGFTGIWDWYETIGVGVRALVDGYWGFTAVPGGDLVTVEELARDAVAQARMNARGTPRTVELGSIPQAVGRWTMPVGIDPFTVPFEEKLAMMQSWVDYAHEVGVMIDPPASGLHFIRRERVVATSDGSRFTQTVYESGGKIMAEKVQNSSLPLEGLTAAGKGWEMVLDADIPAQLRALPGRLAAHQEREKNPKPVQVGRYTVVCDGATMASLLERTLGIATQLDRAMGYEANASGMSFLDEPLEMLGTYQVGSPLVTVTANRSAPGQLATVKWDDEGVMPDAFPLVKDGILVDYQTTREQATWLAPYYRKVNKAVRSHGCAAGDDALSIPLQQMPNLALAPNATNDSLDDLVSNVSKGILLVEGKARTDFQTRAGILTGVMREITNGRLGQPLVGGALNFDTRDLWKHVEALGGPATCVTAAATPFPYPAAFERLGGLYPVKGEPPQHLSCSIQAGAAAVANQPVIVLMRKA